MKGRGESLSESEDMHKGFIIPQQDTLTCGDFSPCKESGYDKKLNTKLLDTT